MRHRHGPAAALTGLALLACQALAGDDHVERVSAALAALDAAHMDDHWQYTMAVQQDGEQRIITHDPTRGGFDVRRLVLVDGKPPDEKTLRRFREDEKKRIDERDPDTASYRYLVDLDSLAPVADRDGVQRYRFAPREPALADEADKLRGELELDSASGQVVQLAISNAGDLSPAFSVTLEHYRLAFFFVQEQGARLLRSMTSEARGTAGFLKAFDSSVKITFSDYRPVRAGAD